MPGTPPVFFPVFEPMADPVGPDTLLEVLKRRATANAKGQGSCDWACACSHGPETFKLNPGSFDLVMWARTTLSPKGRPLKHIMPPLVVVVLAAVLRVLAAETELIFGQRWDCEVSQQLTEGLRYLAVPLGILLVYRLNRSAVRFWEARQAAGKIIELCRTIAGEAAAYYTADPIRDEICRWTVVFPIAVRNLLRGSAWQPEDDVVGILSSDEVRLLQRAPHQPLFVLDRLRRAAVRAVRENSAEDPILAVTAHRRIEGNISTLGGAFGAMERINNTPLPFAYVVHLRTCLMLYLLSMPLILETSSSRKWTMPLAVLLVAYVLLGIEATAVTCERPFGLDPSHLQLDQFCKTIAANIAQILQQAEDLNEDWPLYGKRAAGAYWPVKSGAKYVVEAPPGPSGGSAAGALAALAAARDQAYLM